MAYKQRTRHEGIRLGGLPENPGKRPAYVPYGKIAYAQGYSALEELQAQRDEARLIRALQGKRRHRVEYLHGSGEWLCAARSEWGRTVEQAFAITASCAERYRVVVENEAGGWSVVPRPRRN